MLRIFLISIIATLLLTAPVAAQQIRVIPPVGHKHGGQKAALSKDGKWLVTGDDEGVLKWWDVETGKLLHTAIQESDWLKALIISPNNQWIACAIDNGQINIWSLNSGRLYMQVQAHSLYIQSLSFSSNSKYLASVSSNEDSAAIWDLDAKKLFKKWSIGMPGMGIQFIEGSTLVAITTTGKDGKLAIWDWAKLRETATLPATYPLTIRGKHSLYWKGDTLQLFDVTTGKLHKEWGWKGAAIEKAIFCGESHLLYVSADGVLHKIEQATGREVLSLPCTLERSRSSNMLVYSFVSNSQGTYCMVGDFEGNGSIIDAVSGATLKKLPKLGQYRSYSSPSFSHSGNTLVIPGPEEQAATLWYPETQRYQEIGNSLALAANGAALLQDNYLLHYKDTLLTFFNVAQNQPSGQISIGWERNNNFNSLRPEDKYLIQWKETGWVGIHTLPEGKMVREINTGVGKLRQAILSENGELILTIHETMIQVFHLEKGEKMFSMNIGKYYEEVAAFSRDSKFLLWMDKAGWYKKIELASRKIADSVFIGKDRFSQAFIQSPDGSKLAIRWKSYGEAFSNLSMLDYATGKLLWEIADKYAWLEVTRFSNDGEKMLITTIKGGEAEMRDAHTGKVLGSVELLNNQTGDADFIDNGNSFYVKEVFGSKTNFYDTKTLALQYSTDGLQSILNWSKGQLLVATTADGGIKLLDAKNYGEIATIYLLDGGGWFAINPSGLFDMAPGTAGKLHFAVNDSANSVNPWTVLEFRQLKERYFQPGLLPILFGLRNESLRNVPPFNRAQLPPRVNLMLDKEKLVIRVLDEGGGCGRLSLYIDQIETAENLLPELGTGTPDGKATLYSVDLGKYRRYFSADSSNEIAVVGWNKEQWLRSRPASVRFKQSAARGGTTKMTFKPGELKPSFYAILMGTSDYAGNRLDLNFAAKDAQDFAGAIGLAATKLFGPDRTHVYLLHTGASSDSLQPTRSRFEKYMDQLAERLQPEDVLLVYLSGHGVNYGGQEGDFYYLTKDAGSDEAAYFQDPEIRKMVAISSRELTMMLNKVVARKKVLILDACASGKAAEAIMLAMRDVPASQTRALDRMADRTGFYVLSGSAANAASYESSMFGQGLLTYSLLKGIRGAALRSDGNEEYVDVARLMQYAVEEVPLLAQNIGGIQQPLFRSPDEQKSYDLGRVDESVKKAIKLASPKPMILAASFINSAENEDDLRIGETMNGLLREITARGREADFLFTDAKSFPGAWKLSGSYRIKGADITLDYRLRREDEKFDRTIIGKTNQIGPLLEKLVEELKSLVHP